MIALHCAVCQVGYSPLEEGVVNENSYSSPYVSRAFVNHHALDI